MKRNKTMRHPDFKTLVFRRNDTRPNVYDLKTKGFRKFTFVIVSEPRAAYLRVNGASIVIESYRAGEKTLFTGLIPFGNGIYSGDHRMPKNPRRSFMIVEFDGGEQLTIHYFNHFNLYPAKRHNFIIKFLRKKAGTNVPARCSINPRYGNVNYSKDSKN